MINLFDIKNTLIIILLVLFFSPSNIITQSPDKEENEIEAPHFIITSDDPDVESFPLLGTKVKADIAGVIADVTVTQTYKNEGSKPIEAVYVFPASTNAAVYAMKMVIGDRTIKAEIKEKNEAKQIYEQAKKEGKSASLLEQLKPNIFKMNVANILPGDIIEVELKYTELISPTNKIYEFVFPTLVAPRYNSKEEQDDTQHNKNYTQTKEPDYNFDISVNLQTGMPISELECTSHNVEIDAKAKNHALINLEESDKKDGNKDFIIKYKLAGDKIETGLLLSENDDEKYFTLIVQPPARPKSTDIPAREYIFVMDVSGSMRGMPLTISKKLMINLLKGLRRKDKFNLIQFSGNSNLLSNESLPVNQKNIEAALETISKTDGGGGTEILSALKRIDEIPKENNVSRSVVIVTDGFVRVERDVFDFIKQRRNQMNVFAFGIGKSVNRYIIDGIANVGMGQPAIITDFKEADYEANRFRNYISTPVMTNINIDFKGFLAYDTKPESIPDVFAERPIIIYGKWDNNPTGEIVLEGVSGDEKLYLDIDVEKFGSFVQSDALKYFYARNLLKELADYESIEGRESHKEEIIKLGLNYNLLTDYTSFVAVDSEVRTQDSSELIKQPLPHPEDGFSPGSSVSTSSLKKMTLHNMSGSGRNLGSSVASISLDEMESMPSIENDESIFTKNIEIIKKNFKCEYSLDNLNRRIFTVYVNIKNTKEYEIDIIRHTHPECKEALISAVRKFTEENIENIETGNYQFTIEIENPDKIKIDINHKTYELFKTENYYSKKIKTGFGDEIQIGDNVEITYEIFNTKSTLMDSGTIEFMAGINEVAQVIDRHLINSKKQAEFIILVSPYELSGTKPFIPMREFSDNLIIKFKITEFEIE